MRWAGGRLSTYALCFLCFALVTVLLSRVVTLRPTSGGHGSHAGTVWCRYFVSSATPIILSTISLDLFAVLLGGVVALLPSTPAKCCT